VVWSLALLMALAAGPAWAQVSDADADSESVVAVGMAFNATDNPAEIAYLYESFNDGVLQAGDQILEYRGHKVDSGYDLYLLILALPDVAPGETVPMLIQRTTEDGGTEVLAVEPVAQAVPPKEVDTIFLNRKCVKVKKDCQCESGEGTSGMSCVRTIIIEKDATGKLLSTKATCADGVNVCNSEDPPAQKGK
jgi:hypothetical protein